MIRLIAVICLLFALLILYGCGRSQMQDIADAIAGAKAYQQEPDPARRATIADGVIAHLLAGLDQYPLLPQASATPAEIRADPASYAAAGAKAQADPQPYIPEHHAQPKPKPPGILDRMRTYGGLMLDVGLLCGVIGGALWLLFALTGLAEWIPTGWLGALWKVLRWIGFPVAQVGTWWGGAAAAIGAALTWLADWWWAVAIVAVVAIGIVAWAHWRQLRTWPPWRKFYAWYRKRLTSSASPSVAEDHA